ncbi:YkgJ family cysteine cluster protein [bacterium]|nr:YkgJ family cysteine cluster protein [bacterium]MBU1993096.1 YkgJ family cysteine cluster protein [bacterium]
MSDLVKKEGFPYSFNSSACSTCQGKCCTGESGYVYVNKEEIENIANLIDFEVEDFMDHYLIKNGYRYSLREINVNGSHECIFYDSESNGCIIYQARPSQCITFPFWDYYKNRVDELKQECPGIVDV